MFNVHLFRELLNLTKILFRKWHCIIRAKKGEKKPQINWIVLEFHNRRKRFILFSLLQSTNLCAFIHFEVLFMLTKKNINSRKRKRYIKILSFIRIYSFSNFLSIITANLFVLYITKLFWSVRWSLIEKKKIFNNTNKKLMSNVKRFVVQGILELRKLRKW